LISNEENVLNEDLIDAISNKDLTTDRISSEDTVPTDIPTYEAFDQTKQNLLPVDRTTELTEKEMENIADVAEEEIDVQRIAISKESEFELTQDELEHIARVSCMAEEAFGKLQALQNPQTKLPTDKDLVEDEGRIISDYEEYNVKEAEEFSEQSQSKTSSATSGPDSPQESVDMKMYSILPS
ncbi:unnamed protein product, partial [Acanthocheilonema viteae]